MHTKGVPFSLLLTVALMVSLTACTGDTVPETTFDESSLATDATNEDTTSTGLSPRCRFAGTSASTAFSHRPNAHDHLSRKLL